ncbi:alpha-sarcoglycan isoform X2 [Neocloeon triangulifer]|uniref:alpha-sarcoglycan isoform X2 n=1 Tax=Neocloeon triangulifer TaxID=2078957 RepID=UPI00286F1B2F|nr:alpha-sarcoglycan isoform X2 [Neocloeon triangulifer]
MTSNTILSRCILLLVLGFGFSSNAEYVHMTEVFVLPIEPSMFNWTLHGAKIRDQYEYRPTQINSPDLPTWINFVYSSRHQQGFLFGVPPQWPDAKQIEIEIVALNKETYETRRRVVPLFVKQKQSPAQYEVQLKIHNLNVEDLFEAHRQNRLLDIFKQKLWTASADDLHITMLASAVQLGARLPLRPTEGEGVVLKLGSAKEFSAALRELQKEVKPLWKMSSCPRDYKRTSVERIFRDQRFALDWCSFKLQENLVTKIYTPASDDEYSDYTNAFVDENDVWDAPPSRENVPTRSYTFEFVVTIIVPMVVLILLVILISFILCFHHEGMADDGSEEFFNSIFSICEDYWSKRNEEGCERVQMLQYTPVHHQNEQPLQSTLRRVPSPTPEQPFAQRSMTTSPASSLQRSTSPRMLDEDAQYTRPNPPPYVGIYNNNNHSSEYAQSDF